MARRGWEKRQGVPAGTPQPLGDGASPSMARAAMPSFSASAAEQQNPGPRSSGAKSREGHRPTRRSGGGSTTPPPAKVTLELLPRNKGTLSTLESAGHHPYQALKMSSKKLLVSVLKHLHSKWGCGHVVLRPNPKTCSPLLSSVSWSLDGLQDGLRVADVFNGLGCPSPFQLVYDVQPEPAAAGASTLAPDEANGKGAACSQLSGGAGCDSGGHALEQRSIEPTSSTPPLEDRAAQHSPAEDVLSGVASSAQQLPPATAVAAQADPEGSEAQHTLTEAAPPPARPPHGASGELEGLVQLGKEEEEPAAPAGGSALATQSVRFGGELMDSRDAFHAFLLQSNTRDCWHPGAKAECLGGGGLEGSLFRQEFSKVFGASLDSGKEVAAGQPPLAATTSREPISGSNGGGSFSSLLGICLSTAAAAGFTPVKCRKLDSVGNGGGGADSTLDIWKSAFGSLSPPREFCCPSGPASPKEGGEQQGGQRQQVAEQPNAASRLELPISTGSNLLASLLGSPRGEGSPLCAPREEEDIHVCTPQRGGGLSRLGEGEGLQAAAGRAMFLSPLCGDSLGFGLDTVLGAEASFSKVFAAMTPPPKEPLPTPAAAASSSEPSLVDSNVPPRCQKKADARRKLAGKKRKMAAASEASGDRPFHELFQG
mmetsp:Transcript_14744/g.41512  ORF Transcript_14744/g.41512 Transcript_14744/m.41512 type:complete len:654 (-) Transcript_14744:170-2131(-)